MGDAIITRRDGGGDVLESEYSGIIYEYNRENHGTQTAAYGGTITRTYEFSTNSAYGTDSSKVFVPWVVLTYNYNAQNCFSVLAVYGQKHKSRNEWFEIETELIDNYEGKYWAVVCKITIVHVGYAKAIPIDGSTLSSVCVYKNI